MIAGRPLSVTPLPAAARPPADRTSELPGARMTTSGSGANHRDGELDRLRRQYPRWRIWRGRTTGGYWALPPRDHLTQRHLIGAGDLDELARRLAQAEQRHDP
jgi:hypothetical protein